MTNVDQLEARYRKAVRRLMQHIVNEGIYAAELPGFVEHEVAGIDDSGERRWLIARCAEIAAGFSSSWQFGTPRSAGDRYRAAYDAEVLEALRARANGATHLAVEAHTFDDHAATLVAALDAGDFDVAVERMRHVDELLQTSHHGLPAPAVLVFIKRHTEGALPRLNADRAPMSR